MEEEYQRREEDKESRREEGGHVTGRRRQKREEGKHVSGGEAEEKGRKAQKRRTNRTMQNQQPASCRVFITAPGLIHLTVPFPSH